jgi:hypothetical protein
MTDLRLAVSFAGVEVARATLKYGSSIVFSATAAHGSVSAGLAVKMGAADTVELSTDGSDVLGKLLEVEADGYCVVQVGGFTDLPGGNGASLTLGKKIVGAVNASAAGGYIREVATATAAELGLARGRIINAGTTTAVVVHL